MELLGAYTSRLPEWHSQELLGLIEAGVALGDYGGGKLINQQVASDLQQQGNDFTSLPAILAGSRALAQSVNYPLALLGARYAAIVAEQQDFLDRMGKYLAVLEADAEMVDQLLTAVELGSWVERQPQVSNARRFYADFGATHGPIDLSIPLTDPATGIAYVDGSGNPLRLTDVSAVIGGALEAGVGAPLASVSGMAPGTIGWTYTAGLGDVETLSGPDWASLTLMAPGPLLLLSPPAVRIILPKSQQTSTSASVIQVRSSQVATSNLPVFVRIVFLPRRRLNQFTVASEGQSFSLGLYRVTKDDLIVYDAARSYEEGQHYQIDIGSSHWNFLPLSTLVGKTVNVLVTEYFPAYQCSVNNQDWSPALFLDADNLYPDPQQSFVPVAVERDPQGDWFPITDELGAPVGIFMRPVIFLAMEYLLRIETPAEQNSGIGMGAILEVELERPGYYNVLRVEPFTDLPAHLTKIDAEGVVADQVGTVFSGDVLIDRPMEIRISQPDGSPVYIRKLFLTLLQQNYSLTEQTVNPADQFRRDSLAQLQAVIPFTTRRIDASTPQRLVGAQYEFGLRGISAKNRRSEEPAFWFPGLSPWMAARRSFASTWIAPDR